MFTHTYIIHTLQQQQLGTYNYNTNKNFLYLLGCVTSIENQRYNSLHQVELGITVPQKKCHAYTDYSSCVRSVLFRSTASLKDVSQNRGKLRNFLMSSGSALFITEFALSKTKCQISCCTVVSNHLQNMFLDRRFFQALHCYSLLALSSYCFAKTFTSWSEKEGSRSLIPNFYLDTQTYTKLMSSVMHGYQRL